MPRFSNHNHEEEDGAFEEEEEEGQRNSEERGGMAWTTKNWCLHNVVALSVVTHTKETSNLKSDLKSVVTTKYN